MAIFDIFSKRQKKLRGDVPDVYSYEYIPRALRIQIVHIWSDTLGSAEDQLKNQRDLQRVSETYHMIIDTLCREYGTFNLPGTDHHRRGAIQSLIDFFLVENASVEQTLDVIELSFKAIDKLTRGYSYLNRQDSSQKADEAIEELNYRFKEHGVGYQYSDGQIIRIDSEFVHTEVVKPALRLLGQRYYAGAQEEFLKAHEHYRLGNAKEALNESLKAFESVMKAICDKRGLQYSKNATAKELIKVCMDNELVPPFWNTHYSALRSLLESGVPTGRNKLSGHGQGSAPTEVPNYLVSYMLHMTASVIVFFAEAEAALGK